jgi:hypothetical protein
MAQVGDPVQFLIPIAAVSAATSLGIYELSVGCHPVGPYSGG